MTIIIVIGIIAVIGILIWAVRRFNQAKSSESTDTATAPAAADALVPSGPVSMMLQNVDERTAAVLMSIVADEMGIPPEELRFISIKVCS